MKTKLVMVFLSLLFSVSICVSSWATSVTVDEIIYETDSANPTDPTILDGTVDMTNSGQILTIILANTSTGVASNESSYNLLTGLGFNLPSGMSILDGKVSMDGSIAINFTKPSDNDVSGEYGYDNSPLNAGPFQTFPAGETYSTVNTVVSSMESSSKDGIFGATPIENPAGLAGPEFGLLSNSVASTVAGGQNAIQDSIVFSLTLGGSYGGDLISYIDSQDVVLSFGSPNTSTAPEPATLLLLGTGLIGLAGIRRRFNKG